LWTTENLAKFKEYYVDNPLEDSDKGFFEKLEEQISIGSTELPKLVAEMLWVIHLAPRNISEKLKSAQIAKVWEWSGDIFPKETLTPTAFANGFANTGMGFNTNRWREFVYLYDVASNLKKLSKEQRENILHSPWNLAHFLETIKGSGVRQLRHIILHLLFPDEFERIASKRHREEILDHFSDHLPENMPTPPIDLVGMAMTDWQIYNLRKKLSIKYPGVQLDFYEAPLADKWRNQSKVKTVESTIKKEVIIHKALLNKKIGSGASAWLVETSNPEVIHLRGLQSNTTNPGKLRVIPTPVIQRIFNAIYNKEIEESEIVTGGEKGEHLFDKLSIDYDKYVLGYNSTIKQICKVLMNSQSEITFEKPPSTESLFDEYTLHSELNTQLTTSLLSKPFVILTGASGTGKTKQAKDIAEHFSNQSNSNYEIVAVGADWTQIQYSKVRLS